MLLLTHQKNLFARIWLWSVGIYWALRLGVLWYFKEDRLIPIDFKVYWDAAQRWVSNESLYQFDLVSRYKYSPVFAALLSPFASFFTERLFCSFWIGFNVLIFIFALDRTYLKRFAIPWWTAVLMVIFSWRGFQETLQLGQIDFLLVSLYLLSADYFFKATELKQLELKYIFVSAFFSALILIIKPHFMIVYLVWFLIEKRVQHWKWLAMVICTSLSFLLLLLVLKDTNYLISELKNWYLSLQNQQDHEFMTVVLNQNLIAVISRWLSIHSGFGYFYSLFFLMVLSFSYFKIRQRNFDYQIITLGLCSYLLLSPLSWRWLIFSWVPILSYLLSKSLNLKSKIVLYFCGFLGLLSQDLFKNLIGFGGGAFASHWGLYGMVSVCLYGLLLYDQASTE